MIDTGQRGPGHGRAGGAVRARRRLAAAGAAAAVLALAGCSSSGSGSGASASPSASSPSATAGGTDRLRIKNFAFHPAALTVRPGAVVTVTNDDQTAHTVTATGSKPFDTGDIAPGRIVTFTAPKHAGTYAYMCTIHPFMKGTLAVG